MIYIDLVSIRKQKANTQQEQGLTE